jgi:hypothetical protein
MKRDERKAAIAAWKERRAPSGVYAVRCPPTGEVWVGASPVLDKIRNRIWFMLRQGGSPHAAMQKAWNAHGEDAFSFELLEELPEDTASFDRDRRLAERAERWQAELGAVPL